MKGYLFGRLVNTGVTSATIASKPDTAKVFQIYLLMLQFSL